MGGSGLGGRDLSVLSRWAGTTIDAIIPPLDALVWQARHAPSRRGFSQLRKSGRLGKVQRCVLHL